MASYNRIILVGNLTRDPELSYTPNNVAVCKFGLATNHKRKDKDGNLKEEVCFVDCVAFGRSGETFKQYMAKGRSVLVEGRLKFDQWTSQDGTKRSKHEVVVDNFTFLGGRGESGGGQSAPQAAGVAGPGSNEPPPGDDGIPF
ncbi:MAG: single-stranded DNA-binding protein [Planctomycetes bacterium]|nr:single-stranded DNA-binding protein [Planctomycetota bacterium]